MRLRPLGLIVALAVGGACLPGSVSPQPAGKTFRIGTLWNSRPASPDWKRQWAFVQGLRELGWVEGQNIVIEDRWAEGQTSRYPGLAADLVRLKVDVIVTVSWPAAVAAKNATATIPIVMVAAGDPVATGLVAGLARPGGNLTGVTDQAVETSGKRLELLKEAAPHVAHVAVIWNPSDGAMTLRFRQVQAAARTLGVTVRPLGVQEPGDFDQAFMAMAQERPDALFVVADPLTVFYRKRLVEFAAQHRLPAMFELRAYVDDGGLMAYGPSFPEMFRRGAGYVDKILRGAKPADLPIEQPTRFELVVSLKTAKALGLTMPQSILFRADEVIP